MRKYLLSLSLAFLILSVTASASAFGLFGGKNIIHKATAQTLRIDAAGDGYDFLWNPSVDYSSYATESGSAATPYLTLNFNGDDDATTWSEEAQDLTPYETGNCKLDTSQKSEGTASLLMSGVDEGYPYWIYSLSTFPNSFEYSGKFRFNSILGTIYLLEMSDDGEISLVVGLVNTSGVWRLRVYGSDSEGSPLSGYEEEIGLSVDTWHTLKVTATVGSIAIEINGILITTISGDIFTGATTPYYIQSYTIERTAGNDVWLDEISLATPAVEGGRRALVKIYDGAGKWLMGYIDGVGAGTGLSAEIATGTLTAKALYQITATEVNYFGAGLEVDEYFTAAGTETCDANNKVKRVTESPATAVEVYKTATGPLRGFNRTDAGYGFNSTNSIVQISR